MLKLLRMRELFKDKEIIKKVFTYSLSGIIVVLSIFLFQRMDVVQEALNQLLSVLAPFIWGLVFAFILCRLQMYIEKILPNNMKFKTKRFIPVAH